MYDPLNQCYDMQVLMHYLDVYCVNYEIFMSMTVHHTRLTVHA